MTTRSRLARGLTALSAAVGLAAASLIGLAPSPAAAEDCSTTHIAVTGGSLKWGISESFTRYIKSPITKGGWTTTDGASESDNQFEFPAADDKSPIDGAAKGTVVFNGQVRIFGHKDDKTGEDLLDMTIKDVRLKVDGSVGELIATYKSREYVSDTQLGPMPPESTATLLNLAFDTPVNFESGAVSTVAQATVAEGAFKMLGGGKFGKYNMGDSVDPVTINLTTDPKKCGAKPTVGGSGSGGNTSASGGGAAGGKAKGSGMQLAEDLNDRLKIANDLMGNTTKFLDNIDALNERFKKDRTKGSETVSEKSGGNTTTVVMAPPGTTGTRGSAAGSAAGTGGGATTGTSSIGASGATGTVAGRATASSGGQSSGTSGTAAAGGNAGGGANCDSSSRGIQQATIKWGVKESFVSYVTGSIANGAFETQQAGYDNGQFIFTGNGGSVDPAGPSGTISTPGLVQFSGHEGVLNLIIANPEVTFNGTTGSLIVDMTSNDLDGNPQNFGRVALANLNFSQLGVSGDTLSGQATTALTAAGSKAFADFYSTGQALAPVTIEATLGAAGQCAPASGGSTPIAPGAGVSAAGKTANTTTLPGAGSSSAAKAAGVTNTASETGVQVGAGVAGKKNSFKIKKIGGKKADSANTDGEKDTTTDTQAAAATPGGGPSPMTILLLLLAGAGVAGGTLMSAIRKNPA